MPGPLSEWPAIVKDRLPQRPVVVVRRHGQGADTLLTMARAAGASERKTALKLARSLAGAPLQYRQRTAGHGVVTRLHSELGSDSNLSMNAARHFRGGELTPRTTDHVAASGEILSSKIVAAAFSAQGLNSELPMRARCWSPTAVTCRPSPQQEEPTNGCKTKVSAARRRSGSGDGWICRCKPRWNYHDNWSWRLRFFRQPSWALAWAQSG